MGADEQLAGYHNFYCVYFLEFLLKFRLFKFTSEFFYYLKLYKSLFALRCLLFYCLPAGLQNKIATDVYGNINKDFFNEKKNYSSIADDLYSPKTLQESLIQHFESKLEHLLKWEDHNSMHFSIEARVPFLDHTFVEKTLALNSESIINNGEAKHILRKSLGSILPEKIKARQDKKGFSNPAAEWFRTNLFSDMIWDIINSSTFKNLGYFYNNSCIASFKDHLKGKTDHTKDIWKWINLELWYREFID